MKNFKIIFGSATVVICLLLIIYGCDDPLEQRAPSQFRQFYSN
jgi:hypothetical protein